MTRPLPAFSSALAFLALSGCTEVLVPDGPDVGIFHVHQSPLVPGDVFTSAGAVFFKGVLRPENPVFEHDGACQLEHYAIPVPDPVPVSGPKAEHVDAGGLRVTGGLTDLVMDFEEEGDYRFQANGAIFEAGDVLTLHVEGSDEVPPMSVTLPAPPMAVIAPPPATIDIGEDLTFTWTSPPGTGTLYISLQTFWDAVMTDSVKTYHTRDIVRCIVDVSQGTVTMPVSLLSQLTTSDPRPARVHAVAGNAELLHRAGKSRVTFAVGADAATPSGEAYGFDVDLK